MKKFITLLAVSAIGFAAIGCSKSEDAAATPAADASKTAAAPAADAAAKPADAPAAPATK